MHSAFDTRGDPPMTLVGRLRHLNESLRTLAARLRDAVAGAVGEAAAGAARDAVRALLGPPVPSAPGPSPFRAASEPQRRPGWGGLGDEDREDRDDWREGRDPWRDRWADDEHEPEPEREDMMPPAPDAARGRWADAWLAALRAGLWWLGRQPTRRPLLTTLLVSAVAGGAALVAGPAAGALAAAAASAAGVVLTADAARSAAGLLAGA